MINTIKKWVLSSTFLTGISIFFRRLYLKKKKAITYKKNAFIGFSVICDGRNGFGKNSAIFSSKIGFGSYIAEGTRISKTSIGKYCSIGPNVNCIFGKHPADTFVSTHPAFFAINTPIGYSYAREQCFQEFASPHENGYSISIGNDVWIGANVSLMDGVKIGDGAIVAANALVVKDVEPYTIVGGVPAKIIKKRFSHEEVAFLMEFKWWDKPEEWIMENVHLFKNVKHFMDTFRHE